MSETIEEAWKALQHHLHEYSHDVRVDACNKHTAARALAKAAIHDALEKARNSVPAEWKGNLDYVEEIETAHIDALGRGKHGT